MKNVLIVRSAFSKLYESTWSRALNELGTRCRIFDTHAHCSNGLPGRIQQRILWGPDISRVNRELIRTVKASKPDVTLLYQGNHYRPETIRELRKHTFVAGYHNDDLLGPRKRMLRYRHVSRGLPFYDGYHVYRDCSVDDLTGAGVANAAVLMSHYVPWLDYPRTLSAEDRRRFDCDLIFAGHWEDDRRVECLSAGVDKGIRVRVYGSQRYWTPTIPRKLRKDFDLLPIVHGEDYQKALCGSKIAACFLSKWNRDQYTRRVFEIPACGVFLLAERTPVMQQLYDEGKEAEYFSTPEEFVSKGLFYLKNPAARKRIAAAGHQRATTSGYDVYSRMHQWIRDVGKWKRQHESEVPDSAAA
ncbi:MAG: glycosyltransferase family 1 protein [Candidatus Nealsonbacteria bacterium]|nr:glycosyltransferase family 1 protein [Candidatus Nealsonbacteria bacterium]